MKQRFTKLLAAVALLVFMMPSMAGWGQVSSVAPANGNSYVVAAYVNSKYYALPNGTVNGGTIAGVEITLNSANKVNTSDATGKTWTLVEGTGTNSGQYYITYTSGSDTYYLYKNGTGASNHNFAVNKTSKNYWSFTVNETGYTVAAVDRGTNHVNIRCNSGTFSCDNTATPIILLEIGDATTRSLSVDPSSIAFGEVAINSTNQHTFTVTYANLTTPQTLTVAGFEGVSVNSNTISVSDASGSADVTVTYAPTAVGSIEGNITVSSTTDNKNATVAVTGSAIDASNLPVFVKVTEVSQITTDGVYLLVETTKNKANTGAISNKALTTVGVLISDDQVMTAYNEIDKPYVVTLETADNGYYIKIDGHYLNNASGTDLAFGETGSSVWTFNNNTTYAGFLIQNRSNSNRFIGGSNSDVTAYKAYATSNMSSNPPAVLYKLYNPNQVATPTFNPVAGNYNEAQSVTITCTTENATIQYKTTEDGAWQNYTAAIPVSETTTIWAKATKSGMDDSPVVSATYTITLPAVAIPTFNPAAGTYTEAQNVTIACETEGASILYKLTENGEWQTYTTALTISETTTVWAKATKTGMNDSGVASATYTIVTPITIAAVRTQVTGDVVTSGIITYISGKNAYIQDATAAICVYVNTNNFWANNNYAVGDEIIVSGSLALYEAGGNLMEITPTSTNVTKISSNNELPYTVKTIAEINTDAFGSLQCQYVKIENATVSNIGDNNNYTINQGDNSIIVHGSMSVEVNDVITSFYGNVGYYNGVQIVNPTDVVVPVAPKQIDLRGVTTALVFNAGDFTSSGNGYQSYENVTYTGNNDIDYPGWTLNNVMHSDQDMQMRKDDGEVIIPTILTDYGFTITVTATTNSVFVGVGEDSEENEYTTAETYSDVVIKTGSKYAVISTITITPTAPESHTLTINAYTSDGSGEEPANGWYLIASPLTENTTPTAINGLVASDGHYDLYRFNQNPTVTNEDYLEWENYKIHSNDFVLENGKGYLYASQASTTLYFNGECNTGATKTVNLDYSETNPDVNMRGWNLVGNPFTTIAYANHSYLVMDESGTNIIATPVSSSTAINPFTGVFVQATETGQSVIFSKTAPSTTNNKGVINLALSQQVNRGSAMVDKAVVSFNEGDQLGKFVFMESNAKLYIPKNGKDYAIAVAEGKGEMPVNFKAQKNGTYTLNIDTENVEMNYLHLIDNMTGMDVDLLQTPSYTFDATTNDYASRFRLVFSANGMNENGETETFAFFSNGNWVIGNEGEATLQVIDVNGRIVSNETINGTVATSINATPGVYMLRLVNGNEVKTQKIVVR
jgi:hypothetical protein